MNALLSPLAGPLGRLFALLRLPPDVVGAIAFGAGLATAGYFGAGAWRMGAGWYLLSRIVEAAGGERSRLWVLRDVICSVALTCGLYVRTQWSGYLYFCVLLLVVDHLSRVNAVHADRHRTDARYWPGSPDLNFAVLAVGPLLNLVPLVTPIAAGALVGFELALVHHIRTTAEQYRQIPAMRLPPVFGRRESVGLDLVRTR